MKSENKTMIIGLDGATWDILLPWIQQNKLPFLKKLLEESSYGKLTTAFPSQTAVAWTAFQTAANPGRNGVYDFFKVENGYVLKDFVTSDDIKSPSFWDYMVRVGKKPCVIGLPVSYPLPKIDGIYVAGLMTPANVPYAKPEKIYKMLQKMHYKVEVEFDDFLNIPSNIDRQKVYRDVLEMVEKKIEAFSALIHEDWDLLYLLFKEVDIMQHFFWQQKELLDFWQYMDKKLEAMYIMSKRMFGDLLLFSLMSDHGFHESPAYMFGMFEWLRQNEFLPKGTNKETVLKYMQKTYWWLQTKNIELTKIPIFKKTSSQIILDSRSQQQIDVFYYGLTLNKALYKHTFSSVRNKIIQQLKTVKHNGKQVFIKVATPEKFYSGSQLRNAPDIIFIMDRDYLVSLSPFVHKVFHTRPKQEIHNAGDHGSALEGIFVFNGKAFKRKYQSNGKIYDIIPTIFSLLRIPITNEIDGKIMCDIISEEYGKDASSSTERQGISDLIEKSFQNI